jgi:hypothetical protein
VIQPINSELFHGPDHLDEIGPRFLEVLLSARDIPASDTISRAIITKGIYTVQQSIGIVLDALPSGNSNRARKINGDLFERLIRLSICHLGFHCHSGTLLIPVTINGNVQFDMQYQHDLIISDGEQLKVIGSVKTSSKDRIDKIFIDKLLFSRLTDTQLPHIAIFLNDVQRKNVRKENAYGISSTFLPGHFKGYTVKLNQLDGVYYCDIRPNMKSDPLLRKHIHPIDRLFCSDLWTLVRKDGVHKNANIIMGKSNA